MEWNPRPRFRDPAVADPFGSIRPDVTVVPNRPPRPSSYHSAPVPLSGANLADALSQVDDVRYGRVVDPTGTSLGPTEDKPNPGAPAGGKQQSVLSSFWLRILVLGLLLGGWLFRELLMEEELLEEVEVEENTAAEEDLPGLSEVQTLEEEAEALSRARPKESRASRLKHNWHDMLHTMTGMSPTDEQEEYNSQGFEDPPNYRLRYPPGPPMPGTPAAPSPPPTFNDPPKLAHRGFGDKRLDSLEAYDITPQELGNHWRLYAQKLAADMKTQGHRIKLLYLGDDVFANWGGTNTCVEGIYHRDRCPEAKRRVEETFSPSELHSFAAALPGDITESVLHRIYKEAGFAEVQPWVTVVYVGQNDLQRNRSAQAVAAGMQRLLQALNIYLKGSQIVIVGLLPRGDDILASKGKTPPQEGPKWKAKRGKKRGPVHLPEPEVFTQSKYYKAITEVNEWYQLMAKHQPNVHYVDCTSDFLVQGLSQSGEISPSLLPDMLHLSPQGHARLAMCMESVVKRLYADQAKEHPMEHVNKKGKKGKRGL